MCNLMDYKRLKYLYLQKSSLALCPSIVRFCAILPHLIHNFGNLFPLISNLFCLNLTQSLSKFSPIWSFLHLYSFFCSLTPSLPPTLIVFKNLNIRSTAFLLASSSISFFLLLHLQQQILFLQKVFMSFYLFFLYRWHLLNRCSIVYSVLSH